MALMYALVVTSLIGLPDDSRLNRPAEARPPGRTELMEGLRYVASDSVVRALLGLAVVILFFGQPFQQIMPVFSERIFHVGPGGLGALMMCFGLGAISGAVAVASLSQSSQPALLQLIFGTAFGLGLAGFAFAPVFPIALAALVFVGLNLAAYNALNNTMIMGITEPRFYGRVMSIYQITFAVSPFGALPLAWGVEHVGASLSIASAGLIVAATVTVVGVFYAPYRHIR
jgi:predicted MFS family arabinose efflux permease